MPSSSMAILMRLATGALGFAVVRAVGSGSTAGDFTTGVGGKGRRGCGVVCMAIVSSLLAKTVEKSWVAPVIVA